MIKLLLFHHYTSCMGAGLSLLHILRSLNRDKFAVTVYLPPIPGELKPEIEKLGYVVKESKAIVGYMHFSGENSSFFSRQHISNIQLLKKYESEVKKIILDESPDMLVVNSLILCWMGKIAHQCGVKTICFDRETFRKGLFGVRTEWMKNCLRSDFDGVAYLSDFDKDEVGPGKGIARRITDKVDVELYDRMNQKRMRDELNLPQDKKLILYLGGSNYLKGADVIVSALENVKNHDVQLVYLQFTSEELTTKKQKIKVTLKRLFGKDYQYKVLKIADRKNVQDRIVFRPGTNEPEKYVIASDIVVFPSRLVHQSRPLYEAGIAYKPCVISDFPNTREFASEETSWLAPAGNAKEFARCINEIIDGDQNIVKTKIKQNREQCEKVNNLKTMGMELTAFIEEVWNK